MIIGIGTDILKIESLSPILEGPGYRDDSFLRRTFTEAEIALAEGRPKPIDCYATRFAGKEAVFKALSVSGEDLRLREIEILSDAAGKPYVRLYGNAAAVAEKRGVRRVLISLSYEDRYAVAFAVAE